MYWIYAGLSVWCSAEEQEGQASCPSSWRGALIGRKPMARALSWRSGPKIIRFPDGISEEDWGAAEPQRISRVLPSCFRCSAGEPLWNRPRERKKAARTRDSR